MRLYILNGFNLIPALFDELFTGRALIIGENFSLVPTRRLLRLVVSMLFKCGVFRDAYDHLDIIRHLKTTPAYQDRTDIFYKIEGVIDRRYKFSEIEQYAPDYSMAYKHCSVSYVRPLLLLPFAMRELCRPAHAGAFEIRGLSQDILFFYEQYFGEKPFCRFSLEFELRRTVNGINALLAVFVSLAWIAVKIKIFPTRPQRRQLGADFTNPIDRRGFRLIEGISDRTDDVVFVFRNRWQMKSHRLSVSRFDVACMGDGHFPIALGLRTMLETIFGWWTLCQQAFGLSSPLFLQIILLPIRRMRFRALFQKYRFDNFMSRDDYNPDHCLRSRELRMVGTRSLGIMHGMALEEIVQPSMRFIDFDFYYMFAAGQYRTLYKERFSKSTIARVIGPWGMTPEQITRLNEPRPPNVIYFGRGGPNEWIVLDAFLTAARHFVDRTFYIKLKDGMFRYTPDFLERLESLPDNVVNVDPDGDTYELMLHARYAIGTATTALCEAIGYGLAGFAFDVYPAWYFYCREFPGLCVKTAAELIARIESLEAGTETYQRHLYNDLIEPCVGNPFEAIRCDMGLGLKNPGRPGQGMSTEAVDGSKPIRCAAPAA